MTPDSPPELGGLSREKFIHLSTIGRITGKTHTVELWFAFRNGKVYLSHEGEQTDWMKNMENGARIFFNRNLFRRLYLGRDPGLPPSVNEARERKNL